MKTAPITKIKAQFGEWLKVCREEPVIVTRKGKAVAMLLAIENEEELERLSLLHSPGFRKILNDSEREIQEGKGIRHEDFWKSDLDSSDSDLDSPDLKD